MDPLTHLASLRGIPGLLLVALVTAIAYWPSLGNEFAYDDTQAVQARFETGSVNPMVHELRPVADYFATEYWTGTGVKMQSNPLYRPVTVYSYAATHALAPGDGTAATEARPHHLVNLLLQVVNTVLVFFLVRRFVSGDSFGSVAAAAVFGLAGIHCEAVAAIIGRADLFAFGFGAGALLCCLGLATKSGLVRAALAAGSAMLLFLAFCSKESAVAWWPFLACATLARAWKTGTAPFQRVVEPLAIGIIPALTWWYLRQQAFAGLPAPEAVAYVSNPLHHASVGGRWFGALAVWGYSLLKITLPLDLASDYGSTVFPFVEPGKGGTLLGVAYLLPLVGVGALGVFSVVGRAKRPLLFLTAMAFLGFGFVTSNLPVLIGTIWAERLAYHPSLALAFVTAWLFDTRMPGRVLAGLLGAYLLFGFVVIFTRVDDWKNNQTLFTTDVSRQPRSLVLKLQAAIVEQRRGNWQGWRDYLEAAMALEPNWARPYIELSAGLVMRAEVEAPAAEPDRTSFLVARLFDAERLLVRGLDAHIIEPKEEPMLFRNLAVVRLKIADAKEKAGDLSGAQKLFSEIAADERFDPALRAAARKRARSIR